METKKRKVVQEAIAFVNTGCQGYKTVLMLMAGPMPVFCVLISCKHRMCSFAVGCFWEEDLGIFDHLSAFLMMGGGCMDG